MDHDLAIVLGVAVIAAAAYPGTQEALHRIDCALRFWRNGYSWRAAWRLAEGR